MRGPIRSATRPRRRRTETLRRGRWAAATVVAVPLHPLLTRPTSPRPSLVRRADAVRRSRRSGGIGRSVAGPIADEGEPPPPRSPSAADDGRCRCRCRCRRPIANTIKNPLFSASAWMLRERSAGAGTDVRRHHIERSPAPRVCPRRVRAASPPMPFAVRRRSPAASKAAEKVRALLRKSACAARNAAPVGAVADGRETTLGTTAIALRRNARIATRTRDKKIAMR